MVAKALNTDYAPFRKRKKEMAKWLTLLIGAIRAMARGPRAHVLVMAAAAAMVSGCAAYLVKKPLSSAASVPECAVVVQMAGGPTTTANPDVSQFGARDHALERAWEQFLAEEAMKH